MCSSLKLGTVSANAQLYLPPNAIASSVARGRIVAWGFKIASRLSIERNVNFPATLVLSSRLFFFFLLYFVVMT